MARLDILERKEDILQWVSQNLPNAEIARRLDCKVDTLKSYYKKLVIVYSGNSSRANLKHYESRIPIEKYLSGNSSNSSKRIRLIEEGIKENKCECCGLSMWQGKPIPLELHHKDLNHNNNSLDNLQILCSNCHMQAHNYNNNLSALGKSQEVESSLTSRSLDSGDIIGGEDSLNSTEKLINGVETIQEDT
jgi:5-methylcytosine-specific restriction endonuclease McrA